MYVRTTRASAAKEAAFLLEAKSESAAQQPPTLSAKKGEMEEDSSSKSGSKQVAQTKRSQRAASASKLKIKIDKSNELPHNLGKAYDFGDSTQNDLKDEARDEPTPKKRKTNNPRKATVQKKELMPVISKLEEQAATEKSDIAKLANGQKYTPDVSPFPDWPYPTPEQCQEVADLLSDVHGIQAAPAAIPAPSLTVSGCGEVPSILDAMIRTLLSAATTADNSSNAFKGLVQKFGILKEGIGKGSVNWDAVRQAPRSAVQDAIKSGGLGVVKSRYIQEILEMVYRENKARRDALVNTTSTKPKGADNETASQKKAEIARANEDVLSLDHFHVLDTHEAMLALKRYPGIGTKTASCVLLFCMRRPSFAVDTHVYRLLKWLKWIPPQARGEIMAFKHVDAVVPDNLKYALHQLFIKHGRTCRRCRAATREGCEGWDDGCVIEHLVERNKKHNAKKNVKDSHAEMKKPRAPSSRGKKGDVNASKEGNALPNEVTENNIIVSDKSNNGLQERPKKQQVKKTIFRASDLTDEAKVAEELLQHVRTPPAQKPNNRKSQAPAPPKSPFVKPNATTIRITRRARSSSFTNNDVDMHIDGNSDSGSELTSLDSDT